jgi:hypothetical protein
MAVAASVCWLEVMPPLNFPPTVFPHSTAEEFIVAQLVKQRFGILYESVTLIITSPPLDCGLSQMNELFSNFNQHCISV